MNSEQAFIIGATSQALLYGLYVATLVHCVRWLLYDDEGWSHRKGINRPMLTIAVVIFLFSTGSIALVFQSGFSWTTPLGTACFAMELALIVTTDAVLIYRCWALYSRSWRIIFLPFILWLGGIVCIALIVYLDMFSDPPHLRMRHTSWEAFYSCNIVINIYATTTMVYRILSLANGTNGVSGRLYYKICRILSESGILFALSSFINLIAVILDTNPYGTNIPRKIFNAINISMAGIAFNLILIRVGQERTNPKNMQEYSQNTGPLSALRFGSTTVASSQAQPRDTACLEQEDHMGLDIMAKVESE